MSMQSPLQPLLFTPPKQARDPATPPAGLDCFPPEMFPNFPNASPIVQVRGQSGAVAGFEDERGPQAKEYRQPLEAGKAGRWNLP